MIKNAIFFSPADPGEFLGFLTSDKTQNMMRDHAAPDGLAPQQEMGQGWDSGTPSANGPVASFSGLHAIRLKTLERKLPGAAIKREAEKEIKKQEQMQGGPLAAKEKREIKENVRWRMLPGAPIVESATMAYYDEKAQVLVVVASSDKKATTLLDGLRQLGDAVDEHHSFKRWMHDGAAESVMTTGIMNPEKLPTDWMIGDNCKLEGRDGIKATFTKSEPLLDHVKDHLSDGMLANELGLEVPEQAAFKVDADLKVKGIKFGDMVDQQLDELEDEDGYAEQATLTIEANAMRKVMDGMKKWFDVGAG